MKTTATFATVLEDGTEVTVTRPYVGAVPARSLVFHGITLQLVCTVKIYETPLSKPRTFAVGVVRPKGGDWLATCDDIARPRT